MFRFNGHVGHTLFSMLMTEPQVGPASIACKFEAYPSANGITTAHFMLIELANKKLITFRKKDDKFPRFFMTTQNIARWQSQRNHEMFQS